MAIQMKNLKSLRLSKKLKQSDLGDPPHISRIETGYRSDIPISTIVKIANKLKMSAWELIKYCEESEGKNANK